MIHKVIQEATEYFDTHSFYAVQRKPKCKGTAPPCFQTLSDKNYLEYTERQYKFLVLADH
jgi:hypothetical protein